MNKGLPLLLVVSLCACYEVPRSDSGRAATDGIYQGVVSDPGAHKTLAMHALDGLLLGYGLDDGAHYSAVLDVAGGELDGTFQARDAAGRTAHSYRLRGQMQPHQRLEAHLHSAEASAELSLFHDDAATHAPVDGFDLSGIWILEDGPFALSLSIDGSGHVEGYDSAGCGYFGRAAQPRQGHNLFEFALDVEGCALGNGSEFGFGIARLEIRGSYRDLLILPVWLDAEDRVEAWFFERG